MRYSAAELIYKHNDLYLLVNNKSIKLLSNIFKMSSKKIITLVNNYCNTHDIVLTSIKLSGIPYDIKNQISSKLWMEQDIEPAHGNNLVNKATNYVNVNHGLNVLRDYKKVTPRSIYNKFSHLAKTLKDVKILFISSTPQGGGVALMRHALIRLSKLVGLNIRWHILEADSKIFKFTKKIHNATQNKLKKEDEEAFLNEPDLQYYQQWIEYNFNKLEDVIKSSTIVIIDDPQPSGLIPLIHKLNIPIVFRIHIHLIPELIKIKGSIQEKAFNFFNQHMKYVEKIIFHPVEEFIPYNIDRSKIVKFGAATDNLDGLNKQLSHSQVVSHLNRFNDYQKSINRNTIDVTRSQIIQVSRFDPSKGIPDLLNAYLKFRNRSSQLPLSETPQLVVVGHGAIDDPDSIPILKEIDQLLKSDDFNNIKNDIIISKLPHHIKEDNYYFSTDQVLNALMTKSKFALQLSHKEGYEIKITEALWHGKPVIAYNTGGIPLQLKNDINGYLIETGNVNEVANKIFNLITNKSLYEIIQSNCKKYCNNNFTIDNMNNWFNVISTVLGIDTSTIKELILAKISKYAKQLVKKIIKYVLKFVTSLKK